MSRQDELLTGRLNTRVNKQFRMKGDKEATEAFFIDQFLINKEKVTVWCDGDPVDFETNQECNSWINTLEEIPGAKRKPKEEVDDKSTVPTDRPNLPSEAPKPKQELSYQPKVAKEIFSQLSDITMDNIKRLQSVGGKEYIPQAQAINKEVSNMIELAKTELEMVKVMRGRR